ncbi:MAG: rhodanese-like domain-containing protein [Gammaproteobacteria bacterium]|nr:MAG: rhodanese-like domain-containing protein [Gammaproteobacteria bacterium]RKZ93509.1 MAG: rhodanese-like domain-containing protein [Gammaproteobacteria bacterium]RKZ97233.1 MAG: rhodanese-like domain-containing protein [Gammaproteobacteria bacterium]RLA02542.1 MAG: rhodanese-like domain-containing protein [Gammaproteobacteria bacterium]
MKTTKLSFIVLLLVTLFLSSCSSSDNANVTQISPKESAGLIANDFAVIIDVRSVAEWNNKHIPGATLIPLSDLKSRMGELEQYKDKQLIMQCAVGGRSSKAVEVLQEAGFSNVSNMNGGLVAWEKEGLPLE